jgi:hypothetical protein
MKRLFALFSTEKNYSTISSFVENSLSKTALINIRGGGEDQYTREEDPIFLKV